MGNYYTGTIQKGSKGDDVLAWQKYLNKNYGLELKEDGIFGDATLSATKDFQLSNGLDADGSVDDKTWGLAGFQKQGVSSSTSGNTTPSYTPTAKPNVGNAPTAPTFNTTPTATPTSKPLPSAPTYDTTTWDETSKGQAALGDYNSAKDAVNDYGNFTYKDYEESDAVKGAGAALKDHIANKPGEYQSQWKGQLDKLMNQIMNRDKFSYNFNEDALYQQYKDKYIQQGKLAMGDAMGQAAAMTGGYGSSWAQSVGQQAYQNSLDNLNDVVPELYQMALDRYNMEGQDLLSQYGLVADRENQDYGRYRDTVADWQTDRGYLQGRYDSERDFDYGKYVDDRNMDYTLHQDGYQKLLDKLGIAKDDYYSGADMHYTEQSNKNSVAGQEFNDSMAIWGAESDEAWKKYQADEEARQYANSLLQQDYQNKFGEWEANSNNAWKEYEATESENRYKNEDEWRKAEWDRDESSKDGDGTTDDVIQLGQPGGNTLAAIPDEYKEKAGTFKNNDDLADWAYGLAATGAITEEQADELIENNMDRNEKYNEIRDRTGTVRERTASYSKMLESFDGWEMVTKGGVNLFGIDKDAYVRAPDGREYSLAELKKILIDEGMDDSVAQKKLKGLQQKLGISSNWLFGW